MAKIPDIPSVEDVPQDGPLAWLKNWLATLRLWVQLRDPRMTLVGDPLDKFTDRRELVQLGVLQRSSDGSFVSGPGGVGSGSSGGGVGSFDDPDYATPPAPTGLAVLAGIFQVNLSWDVPTYTTRIGTKTNAFTIIYGAVWATGDAEPTFSDVRTKRLATAEGSSTLYSYPSPAGTRWAFWIAFESYDGVVGPPGGGVHGMQGTTAQDPSALLAVLTGQIRETHLFATLGARINLIDGPDSLAGSVAARVLAEATARGAADASQQTRIGLLETSVDTPTTGLKARATALEVTTTAAGSGNSALATRALALEATVNTAGTGLVARASALEAVTTNASSGNGALATRTGTLEARVTTPSTDPGNPAYNVTYAGLVTEQSVRAALDGSVQALHTVRAEVSSGGRTIVGGFGLAATATSGARPTIDFGVRADTFFVEAPSGGSNPTTRMSPFVIRTSDFYEGGVFMPAGVYMNAAFIVDLTATYARIASLVADQITAASINVSQLVAGALAVGAYAQSTGFVSGTTGWRISGNGNAEFSGVVVRGTIFASAGLIGGNTIDSTGVQSPGYTASTTGWRINSSGTAEFNNVTVRGAVFATSGTFSGSLSGADITGATGTYAGTVRVGASPVVSGTTMTGTGAVFNADGTFALGKPTHNITYNGTDLTINGPLIVTGNIVNDAITPVRYSVALAPVALPSASSGTWRDVLSVPITTTGKPVMVMMYSESAESNQPDWRFMRNSEILATDNDNRRPTPFHIIDAPAAGTHTYKIQTKGYVDILVQRSVVSALELRNSA